MLILWMKWWWPVDEDWRWSVGCTWTCSWCNSTKAMSCGVACVCRLDRQKVAWLHVCIYSMWIWISLTPTLRRTWGREVHACRMMLACMTWTDGGWWEDADELCTCEAGMHEGSAPDRFRVSVPIEKIIWYKIYLDANLFMWCLGRFFRLIFLERRKWKIELSDVGLWFWLHVKKDETSMIYYSIGSQGYILVHIGYTWVHPKLY